MIKQTKEEYSSNPLSFQKVVADSPLRRTIYSVWMWWETADMEDQPLVGSRVRLSILIHFGVIVKIVGRTGAYRDDGGCAGTVSLSFKWMTIKASAQFPAI